MHKGRDLVRLREGYTARQYVTVIALADEVLLKARTPEDTLQEARLIKALALIHQYGCGEEVGEAKMVLRELYATSAWHSAAQYGLSLYTAKVARKCDGDLLDSVIPARHVLLLLKDAKEGAKRSLNDPNLEPEFLRREIEHQIRKFDACRKRIKSGVANSAYLSGL